MVLTAFWSKPITPSHLLDAVAQAFDPNPQATAMTGNASEGMICRICTERCCWWEDNPINQQAAKELLEQMGLSVTLSAKAPDRHWIR